RRRGGQADAGRPAGRRPDPAAAGTAAGRGFRRAGGGLRPGRRRPAGRASAGGGAAGLAGLPPLGQPRPQGAGGGAQALCRAGALVRSALDAGAAGVMTPEVELVPIRVPMVGERAYEAVLVVLTQGGVSGLGAAPVVAARGGSVEALLRELRTDGTRSPATAGAWQAARLDLEA